MIDVHQVVIDGDGGPRARLSTLVDHRTARGVRHDLVSLLFVCATAMLSGARNPTEIAEFGDALSEDLRARLGLRVAPRSGAQVAPSLSTIQRTLRHTDNKEAFDRVVCDTLAKLVTNKRERDNNSLSADTDDTDTNGADTDHTDGDSIGSAKSTGASGGGAKRAYGVAVDGITLRGAVQPNGRAIHLLAAMTHDDKVVIGQREVAHKTNEIKPFAPLRADLDLKDALVTGDTLHTQDAHAHFLVSEKHGDFFLFVKENQPSLYNELVCTPEDAYLETYSESGKGHGRIETCTIRVAPTPPGLVEFRHVAAVVHIDRVVHEAKTGQLKWAETAWAATSASPKRAKPRRPLAASREHWRIENELHWVGDATMREDSSNVRSGSAPQMLATRRNITIGELCPAGAENIAKSLRTISRRPSLAFELLGL